MPIIILFTGIANRLINMLSTAAVWTGPEGFEINEK
jgi:hypothetical protein